MNHFFAFLIGFGTGILVLIIVLNWKKHESKQIARTMFQESFNTMRDTMNMVSMDALRQNASSFLQLADATLSKQTLEGQLHLENKKQLIDQTLEQIKLELKKMEDMVNHYEKDREQKFGQISQQLKFSAEQTDQLRNTTNQLHTALANTKSRGQWGERMAEDVLRMSGFLEGFNYSKQKMLESSQNRPDFTFFLPQDLKIHMDVKFPLDNYLLFLNTQNESEQVKFAGQFIRDVKNRIKEVTGRDYINPSEHTVDFVLVFIPNEQVYHFIHETDQTILDDALRNKVILCSPITLYAILAIIRQSVENFNLEHTASEILGLMSQFQKQWQLFQTSLEKMGKKIEEAQKEYHMLITTRKNQLEKPLQKIDSIRQSKGIEMTEDDNCSQDEYNETYKLEEVNDEYI
ncbi:MAG: DNA recombination protein RmuC [Caldisericia bacterium]|nr:DNA recombination protein RmuC [Caldisericia bacterium]